MKLSRKTIHTRDCIESFFRQSRIVHNVKESYCNSGVSKEWRTPLLTGFLPHLDI